MAIIKIDKVAKYFTPTFPFKKIVALEDINLEVKKGDFFTIVGSNGAGKSTLLKLIMGLLKLTTGKIAILDGQITDREVREKIGFLSENARFYPFLTGKEVLSFFSKLFSRRDRIEDRIDNLLSAFKLDKHPGLKVGAYSKGMTQRLGLAQALLNDPELVILDEPLGGLDPDGRELILAVLKEQHEAGKTILCATHFLKEFKGLSEQTISLCNGRIE
ncbi:MAG: ABC transporter ATP-binding protein [bacterium]